MRTTIELTDQQRAKLLEVSAQRGEKGFSRLIREAIDRYLEDYQLHRERIEAAVAVLGALDSEAEKALRDSFYASRSSWR
ncbi:MAG: hypothetical protein HY319_12615 [Armatimonadetes bacterium]|nr:hypothetical protein [Armatimonadota bacterium]